MLIWMEKHGINPVYYGETFFAATMDNVKRVNQLFPPVWDAMMERFKEGKKKFHYEGPTLSYLYHKIGNFRIADGFYQTNLDLGIVYQR